MRQARRGTGGRRTIEPLERRRLMAATLYAAGGGAYLTEFDPNTGAVIATVTPPAGTGAAGVTAVAAAPDGDVFAIDAGTGDVLRVGGTTHAAAVFLAAGAGGLGTPVGLTVAADGSVVVADANAVYRFTAAGTLASRVATGTNAAVLTGTDGTVYAVQTYDNIHYVGYTIAAFGPAAGTATGRAPLFTDDHILTGEVEDSGGFTVGGDGRLYAVRSSGGPLGTGDDVASFDPAVGYSSGVYVPVAGVARYDTDPVAVDSTGDLFAVDSAGGIDRRSAATGDVTAAGLIPAGATAYNHLVLAPLPAAVDPAAIPFGHGKVARSGKVTARLTGPGSGYLVPAADGTVSVTVTGTTARSTLTLAGRAGVAVDGIHADGPLANLTVAGNGSLAGTSTVSGTVDRLTIGTLAGTLTLFGTAAPVRAAAVHTLAANAVLTAVVPITTLTTAAVAAGAQVMAPSVGTLRSAGTFGGTLHVTAADLGLGRATFRSLAGATLLAAGSIGSIRVAGDVVGTGIFAGNSALTPGTANLAQIGAAGTIASFVQPARAAFADSAIVGSSLGTILAGAASSTTGNLVGVAAYHIDAVRLSPLTGGGVVRDPAQAPDSPDVLANGPVVVQIYP